MQSPLASQGRFVKITDYAFRVYVISSSHKFPACSLCAHKNSGKRWGFVRDSVNYALLLLFGDFGFNFLSPLIMLSLRALP